MTCYQRQLTDMFELLELTYDRPNRQRVHGAIVELLELPEDAHCPVVWAALKNTYGTDGVDVSTLAGDVARVLADA